MNSIHLTNFELFKFLYKDLIYKDYIDHRTDSSWSITTSIQYNIQLEYGSISFYHLLSNLMIYYNVDNVDCIPFISEYKINSPESNTEQNLIDIFFDGKFYTFEINVTNNSFNDFELMRNEIIITRIK